jgi:hypothetical protein
MYLSIFTLSYQFEREDFIKHIIYYRRLQNCTDPLQKSTYFLSKAGPLPPCWRQGGEEV